MHHPSFHSSPCPALQINRRRFISTCAACLACGASPIFKGLKTAAAQQSAARKPNIRLVFCETPNNAPIWPNIGYDFARRRQQLTALLTGSCPGVEFRSAQLSNDPKEADALLAKDAEVDGYLICVQGLGWSNDIVKLSATGKPTLLVDNLFGGSGLFLRDIAKIMGAGKPVDWVSSSQEQDLVASARHFAGLAVGKTGGETVAAFREARRTHTPPIRDWTCQQDRVTGISIGQTLEQLRRTRLLVVGGGWGGDEFRKASKDVTGVEFVPIAFEELAGAYAKADAKAAREFAERWSSQAEKIDQVASGEIEKAGMMYVAMKQLLEKHQARGISVNCLGGFYGGHLQAYPCLGFCQLNNDGLVGGCEADQMSALTMAVVGGLTGRPGMISDPVIDTSKNAIIYAHCVAMTKAFGPGGSANAYHIQTHSEDRKGASMRSLLPVGYMTTTLELNPTARQMLMHRAKTIGNNPSDMACRTKLEAVVKGDLEKLTEHWSMGWHRVTFYGDLQTPIEELCRALKLELVQEA